MSLSFPLATLLSDAQVADLEVNGETPATVSISRRMQYRLSASNGVTGSFLRGQGAFLVRLQITRDGSGTTILKLE